MAPALTQASDPQSLAPHHPSPDKRTSNQGSSEKSDNSSPSRHLLTSLHYGGLKEPKNYTDIHFALSKGNCQIHCLLPPSLGVSGREGGREGLVPPDESPQILTVSNTMDPQVNVADKVDTAVSSQVSSNTEVKMGQNTIQQASIAAQQSPHCRGQKSPKATHDGDLMSLIGRDFANMNEIIDTLAQWADNPEVMAAVNTASLTLPNNSNNSSQANSVTTPSQPDVSQPAKEEQAQSLLQEYGRRQWQLERRQARILRRLRRVTARGLGASVSGQLRELLHFSETALKEQREQSDNGDHGVTISSPPELGVEALRADAMRTMSTSALVNLVRRVEASQGLARLAAASHHRPLQMESLSRVVAPTLPDHVGREVETLAAEMRSASHSHSHHDSDATESSSGGDSCDELEGYSPSNPFYAPVNDRAYYRYCRSRSWVASRWTWLQAQVADLEYRILQQQKIYTHVRNNKGSVQVDESRSWRGPPPRDPAHLDMHDPALTCLTAPTMRTTINGYHSRIDDSSHSETSYSSRTQGVKAVKRRRLVRTGAGVALRRGGRIPPVPCKCGPPLSCVLCVKVANLTSLNNVPDPDTQPSSERHARVDPTYHPVLSQQADISLSECFDSILKTTDWQRQAIPSRSIPPLPTISHIRETTSQDRKRKRDRKKEYKKHKKEGKGRITLKLKKSLFTGDISQGEEKRKRHASQEQILHYAKVTPQEEDDDSSLYGSSLQSSPSESPAPIEKYAAKKQGFNMAPKNKQSSAYNSYDIDNIVIPYSMAASTRVEKLEYKEIITPKWRQISSIPNNIQISNSREEENEDVSDSAVLERHNRSEELERKKFLQYLTLQVSSRAGRSRRTDSSGTNTPDHPLSPRGPVDPSSDTISPLATPPSTPLAPSEDSNPSSSLNTNSNLPLSFSIQNNTVQLDKFTLQNCNSNNQSSSSAAASAFFSLQSSALSSLQLGDASKAVLLRRNRSMSYGARLRTSISSEDGIYERTEEVSPYEQRVFPLDDEYYSSLLKESNDCDISPLSPPPDSSTTTQLKDPSSLVSIDSPASEVTDSAPEDELPYDESAMPTEWTISGVKDPDSGQCVLQIQRHQ